jgi:ribosomal protein S10
MTEVEAFKQQGTETRSRVSGDSVKPKIRERFVVKKIPSVKDKAQSKNHKPADYSAVSKAQCLVLK